MDNESLEILDLLIQIEREMARLYFDFAMLFQLDPDQHSFWQNIAMEEIDHASFLESQNQIISAIAELKFVQFINRDKLNKTLQEIRTTRSRLNDAPYTHQQAIELALTLEVGYNEHLLRHSLKIEIPELRNILQTLETMNEKHIQLLSKYKLEHKS
ncbi:MAG: hypothetical protein N3A72_12180 [bacterium]|nr:hypothetical protein [bacterium]